MSQNYSLPALQSSRSWGKQAPDISCLHSWAVCPVLCHLGGPLVHGYITSHAAPAASCTGLFWRSDLIPSAQLGCFFWRLFLFSHWPNTECFSSGISPWGIGLKSNFRLWAHVTPGFVARATRIYSDFVFKELKMARVLRVIILLLQGSIEDTRTTLGQYSAPKKGDVLFLSHDFIRSPS